MPTSDLPFGSEFSPSQISLRRVLELAGQHGGDWRAFERALRREFFEEHETSEYNKNKLANNTKLGMIAYGITDREARLTEFGRRLYDLRADEPALCRELARHILLNLHGVTLVQCVQDMHVAGEDVNLVKLREWLAERGIVFPRGGKHPSIMRLWLEKAGVFTTGWRVDEGVLQAILGVRTEEIEALAQMSREQADYLRALSRVAEPGASYPSNEIEKLAAATYGTRFNEKSLAKDVLYPLQDAGYIALERGTRQAGRGAKPFKVTPTPKLVAEVIDPLLRQLEQQVHPELRPLLRQPLGEILHQLRADDRHRRGLALEALALKLMRLVDLSYVATRLRGDATGGAEVDLVFESARLAFSRWQVQCKNTPRVSLDDVAKEVGLTHFLKSNVIVVVTTGEVGPEARRYASKIMKESNLAIVMIEGADVSAIKDSPAKIVDILAREAKQAMALKVLEL